MENQTTMTFTANVGVLTERAEIISAAKAAILAHFNELGHLGGPLTVNVVAKATFERGEFVVSFGHKYATLAAVIDGSRHILPEGLHRLTTNEAQALQLALPTMCSLAKRKVAEAVHGNPCTVVVRDNQWAEDAFTL